MSLARAVLTRNTNTTPKQLAVPFSRGVSTSPTTSPPSPSIQSPITQAIERRHHHVDWDAMVKQAQQDRLEEDEGADTQMSIDVDEVHLRKEHLEALMGLRDADTIDEEISPFDEADGVTPNGMSKADILRFLVTCLDSSDSTIASQADQYVNSCVTLLLREQPQAGGEDGGQSQTHDGEGSARSTTPPPRTPTPPGVIEPERASSLTALTASVDVKSNERESARSTSGHSANVQNGDMGSAICSGVVTSEGLNLYQQRYVEECGRVRVTKGGWRAELATEDGQELKTLQPNRSLLFKLGHISESPTLDLSANLLGASGVIPLMRILYDAKWIVSLDLSDNDLQDSSIPELRALLSANPNITKLNLSNNQRLAATAGKDLIEMLRQCPHVCSLELRNTNIPKHCLQNIATLVQSNSDRLHAERRQVQSMEVSEGSSPSAGASKVPPSSSEVSPSQQYLHSNLRHH